MTPKEKWDRINNPMSVEDYGLFLTEDELRTFLEGRKLLLGVRIMQRKDKKIERWSKEASKFLAELHDKIALKAMMDNVQ